MTYHGICIHTGVYTNARQRGREPAALLVLKCRHFVQDALWITRLLKEEKNITCMFSVAFGLL